MQTRGVIYMKLLNEGVDCWRPVKARLVSPRVYVIVDESEIENGETWEFHHGDKVVCKYRTFVQGERKLTAFRKSSE